MGGTLTPQRQNGISFFCEEEFVSAHAPGPLNTGGRPAIVFST